MALTTPNLITRCEERFKDTANEVVSEAEWLSYLNEAYQEVNASYIDWPWMKDRINVAVTGGASNQVSFDADFDVLTVTAVYNVEDQYLLLPLEGNDGYRLDYPGGDSEVGDPTNYRWHGTVLELWPNPATDFTLAADVNISPADLATSSSDPLWPNRYRRALVELALSRAYLDDGNAEWAATHRAEGERIIGNMVNDLLGGRIPHYPYIQDNWF
jgi:hypothetical protein